ncbi:MAG: DNA repair and recombination protein RadB [Methanomassiliicoccales archaeon PtaU1.Bin124]|nr:MAG: DNA repair and recombination protein RadB [Methanomassiliicoccales archaeon PtaU1.Bin124]
MRCQPNDQSFIAQVVGKGVVDVLPLDCPALDALLGGGIETGCITLLYGEAGTGKTNLCLVLASKVAEQGRKVVFVDTEGVSMRRLEQVSGQDPEAVAKNFLVFEAHSFKDQETMVDKAIKLAESSVDVGLVVVDSMTMYYRLSDKEEERAERRSLANQSAKLLTLARKKGVAVLLTSQVFLDVERGIVEALGGNVLHHNAKTIVKLERAGIGKRRATIMKHRHLPEGRSADFYLTESGIACD